MKSKTRSWNLECLLDPGFRKRVSAIETLTANVSWTPRTVFAHTKERLIQSQQFIQKSVQKPTRQHIYDLAQVLDKQLSIIHGDLCIKNLIFDGKQLWVIDWEPSLMQSTQGVVQFLVTEPYWALDDRINQCVSYKTDKLTFFFTAFRIIHQRNPLVHKRAWIKVRQTRPVPMTPILEQELYALSFTEIVELVDRSVHWTPRLIFGEER